MKTYLQIAVLGLMLSVAGNLWAQESVKVSFKDVPEVYSNAFLAKFKGVEMRMTDWHKEPKTGTYEVDFPYQDQKVSAKFAKDGTWLETEYRNFPISAVPGNAGAYVQKNYPGFELQGIEKEESPKGVEYEFDIVKGEQRLEVVFDKDGKFLKEERE